MLYLYLDESGDLGFDFVNKKPSEYFTICILTVKGKENDRALAKAVKAVIGRKLRKGAKKHISELKGIDTTLPIKKYFYRLASRVPFNLYSVTLNKRNAYDSLSSDKERIYNYIARLALEHVDFRDAAVRVIITVDKSKARQEIFGFNRYIIGQVKAAVDPRIPLEIYHVVSNESPGLQAADLFAWGVSRKYELRDMEWYSVFRERLKVDRVYLP
jgi:hypothetical protein